MKVIYILCFLLLHISVSLASPRTDSLINALHQAIQQADLYDNNKLKEISVLKNLQQHVSKSDVSSHYDINLKLYEEYKYYNYDSALKYARKLQQFAGDKNDPSLVTASKLRVVFIMLSGGMFKETFDYLNVISVENAPDSVKAEYYTLTGLAYYNLSDFNNQNDLTADYQQKASLYLDSALTLYDPQSFKRLYYSSLKFLKKGNPDSALSYLNRLIHRKDLSHHQVALATSTLAGIFMSKGQEDQAKPYLIEASIADIKSSTKENLALLILAGIEYKVGNLHDAALYIEKANADATFYNARLRKVQIGALLPLIQGEMINTIQSQKQKLVISLISLAVFALVLAAFAIIIRKQVTKLKEARLSLMEANLKLQQVNQELVDANELKAKYNEQLKETNHQLVEANAVKEKYNDQLQVINKQLSEANRIKEEYIGYYFNMDTQFLGRIEKLIHSIDKKLIERKWEEIKFILKSVDLKKEKDELLKHFDKVFVRLFPNFVSQFNTLFREEDKIILKEDQLLNTDLRIFALIRMGITDNEKIAGILDYSINTIYSKKTKIRNKTIIPKDELEKRIMEITALSI